MSFFNQQKGRSLLFQLLSLALLLFGSFLSAQEVGSKIGEKNGGARSVSAAAKKPAAKNSPDGYSFLVESEENQDPAPVPPSSASGSSETAEVDGEDPESAEQKAQQKLSDLIEKANSNPETAVATTPEEFKNGSFNKENGTSNQSSLTFHPKNQALCLASGKNGSPDGANCSEWMDKDASEHGESEGDSSDLEKVIYGLWKSAKNTIGQGVYRIWNVAVKSGENLLDLHGRLNIEGLSKYELNDEATKRAAELGARSAERALGIVFGNNQSQSNQNLEAVPPEVLRTLAVNITRSMANQAVSQWAGIQAAKKGVEVVLSEDMRADKYKSEVEKKENKASGEERLATQAPIDVETEGISLEDRVARAEALKNANVGMVNPTFNGDKIEAGDPSRERYDEWAYRATVEQLANPFINADQIQRPQDVQLSQRQIASELTAGPEDSDEFSEQTVVVKQLTTKKQIEAYNQQLEIAARNMEAIAAESSSFANTADKIRSNKLKEGETVLTINDLTPYQKKKNEKSKIELVENPSPKVEIPTSSSKLTFTKF